ncbi:MAG: hypothetical protein ACR2F2_02965 [Pyrinomonadaceae bacterium]
MNFIFVENVSEVFAKALRETILPVDKSENGKPKQVGKAAK